MNLNEITQHNIQDAYFDSDGDITKKVVDACTNASIEELKSFFQSLKNWESINLLAQLLNAESEEFTINHYMLTRNEEEVIDIRYKGTFVR